MTVFQCSRLLRYLQIVSLTLLMVVGMAMAAPPDLPKTADDIENALTAPGSAQTPLPLRGGSRTPTPGVGRVRGLGGIVDDPSTAPAQPSQPQAVPSQTASPRTIAASDYPTLTRNRPQTAALINFDSNSARIRSDAFPLLNEYVNALQRAALSDAILVIAGHTDAVGSEQYNLQLSTRRAQAVKDYLAARGIAEQRLIVRGFGEAYPVASNATDEGREMNRRSEFIRVDVPPTATE